MSASAPLKQHHSVDSTSYNIDKIVDSLLKDGKQPPEELVGKNGGQIIADALADRLDTKGVQPSRAAHAMCGAAAKGSYAIVQMLASRPASTFNKAYNFSEPLRRTCRSWARETDAEQRRRRLLCAVALVAAKADLDAPDKYLKSKQSARQAINSINNKKESAQFFEDLNRLLLLPPVTVDKGKVDKVSMSATTVGPGNSGTKRKRS